MSEHPVKRWIKGSTVLIAVARAVRDGRRQTWGRLTRSSTIAAHRRRGQGLRVSIGADDDDREGWLASDYSPRHPGVIYLDATRRFPFEDGEVDHFHAEHMIEHVPLAGGRAMLAECFRTLRPGGRVRIATPDLGRLSRLLASPDDPDVVAYVRWSNDTFGDAHERLAPDKPVSTFNRIMREWGHTFLYDGPTLEAALADAGFVDVVRCEVGESDEPSLRGLELHGLKIGEAANRFETMIYEGRKPS